MLRQGLEKYLSTDDCLALQHIQLSGKVYLTRQCLAACLQPACRVYSIMPDSSAQTQGWREEDVVSKGVWHQLADGSCMWSLSIVTSGAYSHVVVFRYITNLIPYLIAARGKEEFLLAPRDILKHMLYHACMRWPFEPVLDHCAVIPFS